MDGRAYTQAPHKNAVKQKKQKIVSLRALDAKDIESTTDLRKETQGTLDAANIRLIRSIPGLSGIRIPGGLTSEEDCDQECDDESKAVGLSPLSFSLLTPRALSDSLYLSLPVAGKEQGPRR